MIVERFPVGPLGCNCVILGDEESGEAIVVDPGGEVERILARLRELKLRPVALVHTHTHFDHVAATTDLQRETAAPVALHESDLDLYRQMQMQLDAFGLPWRAPEPAEVDRFLREGDVLRVGDAGCLGVLHTPGHTPGSLSLVVEGASRPMLLAGDTLFQRSVGRTDLWGGDTDALVRSIRKKLFELPDETLVVCGHGPETTIGEERRFNPFVGEGA